MLLAIVSCLRLCVSECVGFVCCLFDVCLLCVCLCLMFSYVGLCFVCNWLYVCCGVLLLIVVCLFVVVV